MVIPIEELKEYEIFKDLTDEELECVGEIAKIRKYTTDQRIFAEKSIANKLFLVSKGRVVIKMSRDCGRELLPVDTIGPGEIFGWSSVAEPHCFTAAAFTLEDSELYVLNGDVLRDLFRKNNHIGYKVMKEIASIISSRLRQLNMKFVNSV